MTAARLDAELVLDTVVDGVSSMIIGRDGGAEGIVSIHGANSRLQLDGIIETTLDIGPIMRIGREGTGTVNVFDGGELAFVQNGAPFAQIDIGGSGSSPWFNRACTI